MLNWELEDLAWPAMVGSLTENLRKHAQAGAMTQKEPSDADLQRICREREPRFAKGTFLWHKTKAEPVQEMSSELQMAAPVLGGMLVADEVIDLLLPVIFNWYQCRRWRRLHPEHA